MLQHAARGPTGDRIHELVRPAVPDLRVREAQPDAGLPAHPVRPGYRAQRRLRQAQVPPLRLRYIRIGHVEAERIRASGEQPPVPVLADYPPARAGPDASLPGSSGQVERRDLAGDHGALREYERVRDVDLGAER